MWFAVQLVAAALCLACLSFVSPWLAGAVVAAAVVAFAEGRDG